MEEVDEVRKEKKKSLTGVLQLLLKSHHPQSYKPSRTSHNQIGLI